MQVGIHLAERNCIRPGATAEITHPLTPSQLQPLGQIRATLLANTIQYRQHMATQLRIGLEHMAIHRPLPRTNRLFQFAPVVPLGVV